MSLSPVETGGNPFIFSGDDAVVTILGVKLNCIANKVTLAPATTIVTATTLCAAVDYPGAVKWSLQCILYQSFEDLGAYDVLSAAWHGRPKPVPFTVSFKPGAPADNAPQFAGELVPQAFTVVDSEAGALVEVDFTWGCTGEPTEDFGDGPNPIGTQAATKFSNGAPVPPGTQSAPAASSSSSAPSSTATAAA